LGILPSFAGPNFLLFFFEFFLLLVVRKKVIFRAVKMGGPVCFGPADVGRIGLG
jgi:hypothetical protein